MHGKFHLCTAVHRWDQPLWSDTWLNRIEKELQLECCDADLTEKPQQSMTETKNINCKSVILINGLNSHHKKKNHTPCKTANLKWIMMWFKCSSLDVSYLLSQYLVLYWCIKQTMRWNRYQRRCNFGTIIHQSKLVNIIVSEHVCCALYEFYFLVRTILIMHCSNSTVAVTKVY